METKFYNESCHIHERIWYAFNEAEKLKLKGEMENANFQGSGIVTNEGILAQPESVNGGTGDDVGEHEISLSLCHLCEEG